MEASRLLLVEVTFCQLDAELVEKISNATAIARENLELVAALAEATIGQREAASNAAAAEACQARGLGRRHIECTETLFDRFRDVEIYSL